MAEGSPPETDVAETPLSWRVTALAWLAASFTAGYLGARIVPTWLSAGLAVAVPVAIARPLLTASRRPPVQPAATLDGSSLAATVIVTARNEAAVIGNIVADLGRQDLLSARPDALDLVVIDDGSTDGTADVARGAARATAIESHLRIVRRTDGGPRLKSAALNSVAPGACRGDVIVHLDADARVEPDFLTAVLRYVAVGVRAMTARRLVLPRPGS